MPQRRGEIGNQQLVVETGIHPRSMMEVLERKPTSDGKSDTDVPPSGKCHSVALIHIIIMLR
jgi:hypothetical protein